jgi:hypothetical protein
VCLAIGGNDNERCIDAFFNGTGDIRRLRISEYQISIGSFLNELSGTKNNNKKNKQTRKRIVSLLLPALPLLAID